MATPSKERAINYFKKLFVEKLRQNTPYLMTLVPLHRACFSVLEFQLISSGIYIRHTYLEAARNTALPCVAVTQPL